MNIQSPQGGRILAAAGQTLSCFSALSKPGVHSPVSLPVCEAVYIPEPPSAALKYLCMYFCIQSHNAEKWRASLCHYWAADQTVLENCLTSGLASLLLGRIDLRLLIICIKLRTNERKLIYCFRLSVFLYSPVSTNNWELAGSRISGLDRANVLQCYVQAVKVCGGPFSALVTDKCMKVVCVC